MSKTEPRRVARGERPAFGQVVSWGTGKVDRRMVIGLDGDALVSILLDPRRPDAGRVDSYMLWFNHGDGPITGGDDWTSWHIWND